MTDKTLLFPLDETGVNDWLARWQNLSINDKVNQLHQVLSHLHESQPPDLTLWPMLMKLAAPTLAFLDELDDFFEAQAPRYSEEKKLKIVHIILQLNQKLSVLLAKQLQNFTAAHEALLPAFALTLHSMAAWLMRFYRYHDMPKPLYWETLGRLYLKARDLALLEHALPALPIKTNLHAGTLQTLFQHCLLYDICCAGATAKTDRIGLFALSGTLCRLLVMREACNDATVYCWHPEADLPPLRYAPDRAREGLLYLDASDLLDVLEAQPNTLTSVLPRLSAYRALRATVDVAKAQECGLVIGLETAVLALNALISQYRILDLSGAIKQPRPSEGLSLEPLQAQVPAVEQLLKELSKIKTTTVNALRIKVYATAQSHFFVTQLSAASGRLDDLAILLPPSRKPLLAIVRYLRVEAAVKIKHALLEIIDGEVYPIPLGNQNGIIVYGRSGAIELFLPPAYYAKNTLITIPRGVASGRYTLTRFIELTACYVRFEIMWVD